MMTERLSWRLSAGRRFTQGAVDFRSEQRRRFVLVVTTMIRCRGGLLARRFRCSRYGLDRTAYRQGPESGSGHTETSCKTLHRQSETHQPPAQRRFRRPPPAPIRSSMPPCSGQSRPSPSGGREDAASLDRPCARRLCDLAVGTEECSRRGSNQRMDPTDHANAINRDRRSLLCSDASPCSAWFLTATHKSRRINKRTELRLVPPTKNACRLPVATAPKTNADKVEPSKADRTEKYARMPSPPTRYTRKANGLSSQQSFRRTRPAPFPCRLASRHPGRVPRCTRRAKPKKAKS